ncbi:MAG: hypothetical protein ACRBBW_13165 [Cellvibrionaceae bacterium]
MSTPLKKFRSEVLTDVSGVPGSLIDRHILRAAIEFCDYTLTWREKFIQTTDEGVMQCLLTPDEGSRVVTVLYVGDDGVKVAPATESRLDDTMTGWRDADNDSASAQYYFLEDRETLSLVLTPDAERSVEVVACLKPTQDATELHDDLYEDHIEALGYGAKARLFAMPAKPWSNPELAMYFKKQFEDAKDKEKAERLNDYTRESSLIVRPHNYYG